MANERLSLILRVDEDSQVKRRFDESVVHSHFMVQLNQLREKQDLVEPLLKAFERINRENPFVKQSVEKVLRSQDNGLFIEARPVPWYFDEIGRELMQGGDACKLRVKSCAGDLFVDLVGRDGRPKIPPFYHRPGRARTKEMTPEEQEEQARGIADTILLLAPEVNKITRDQKITEGNVSDLLKWFEIELAVDMSSHLGNGEWRLDVEATPKWNPSEVDESKQTIRYQLENKEEELLIASRNVRDAINDLAEAWHNPGAKSLLLSAWTGSGKDVLKDLFLYGLCLQPKSVFDFAAPDLSSEDDPLEALGKLLIEKQATERMGNRYVCHRCAVFVDEIHHPTAQRVREVLLRFMSTHRLDRPHLIDCGQLFSLFAASMRQEQLRALRPPDFWNRIQYPVEMKHPLLLSEKVERLDALRQYFCLFWRKAAKKARRTNPAWTELVQWLCEESIVTELSKSFAEQVGSPLIPIISIRTLETLVARVFSRATYRLRTGSIQKSNDVIVNDIGALLDKWVYEIVRELVPEINPEGSF